MNTAIIFKEELNNAAIWNTIIMDLGLEPDTDKITVKAVSESKTKKTDKPIRKKTTTKLFTKI